MNTKYLTHIAFLLIILSMGMIGNAQATPYYMQYYGAPECQTCHTDGTVASARAGLAAFLASKTPTCTAPQVLQNNVCVTPTPTCVSPEVLQGNVCVTPTPTCVAPQVLQNNVCVTLTPTCSAPQVLQNDSCITPPPTGTMVRMKTNLGNIDIRLFDNDAPLTVANFLSYVDSGAYSNSIIDRSNPGFNVQGGGYVWKKKATPIAKQAPVVNEFNPGHSNLRGTISMVKMSGKPDSATSQWAFNLVDNSAILDYQNGGSTVFGQVDEKSMTVVDKIAALPLKNAGGALNQVPMATSLTGAKLKALLKKPLALSNLVSISSITTNHSITDASDSDRIFAYLEATYPETISPANALAPANSGSATNSAGYYYRYYSTTKSYIATFNGQVYFNGPSTNKKTTALGSLNDFLALAVAAGY